MDADNFRVHGKQMVDFVADYWSNMRERTPLPDVKPGYINELVPATAPENPEDWKTIFEDLENVVMKGNTNWQHPHFFAYFTAGSSYQAILGDILSAGINSIGFSWSSSPSMTELEMKTLDWLVDILDLPQYFKNSSEGPGCGIIQSTASDATMIAIITARAKAIERIKEMESNSWTSAAQNLFWSKKETEESAAIPYYHDSRMFERLVAYTSDQGHCSIEKAAMLSGIRLRRLKSCLDEKTGNYAISKEELEKAVQEDRTRGLVPFILLATMGTTSSCGFDKLDELGPICEKEQIWLHVDAAYAGSFLMCPELRYMSKGMEFVDSFNFNAHKAMLINFDCSPMWFKDGFNSVKYYSVDPTYFKHEHQNETIDYRHLQIACGRRFRSLKIWFVLRNFGVENIRKILRNQIELASFFAELIRDDNCFELVVPNHLGLVCFKIKNSENPENEELCDLLNKDRRIHLVPTTAHGIFYFRLAICSQFTTKEDMRFAYSVLKDCLRKIEKRG